MTSHDDAVKRLREKPVVAEAFVLLAEKLPPNIFYHTLAHTEDVFVEALRFAEHDGLDGQAIELLAIAAAYHDTGFIEAAGENEQLGASLAVKAMRRLGSYTDEQINLVSSMILDTTLRSTPEGFRQVPRTDIAKYLCDADVSNLGRVDFFEKAELIRQEIGSPPKREFLRGVAQFLASHRWHTPAATALRQAQKEKNAQELEILLRSLS